MTGLIESLLERGVAEENVALGPFTTYKSGGPARFVVRVETRETFDDLIRLRNETGLPLLVIGRGSNLLVADEGFDGIVIRLGADFGSVIVEGDSVRAGAATPLAMVARAAVDAGLNGLEFFVGIPGSVGGAIRQNAGCFGVETRDVLIEATTVDLIEGGESARTADDLDLSYRHSNVESHQVVTGASFRGSPGDVASGRAEMKRITRWRRDHQPGGTFNAGSVFKNPDHISAGELIDSLGLKGLSLGAVSVSEKHANFFVAGADATSREIAGLVDMVKDRVFQMTGTKLEPEIQFVGFNR
jgi:UDP-N-acetylmuramate dehydrogenase